MRYTVAHITFSLALLLAASAAAQPAPQAEGRSHYSQPRSVYADAEDERPAGEYVFPAKRRMQPVSQAAWNEPTEQPPAAPMARESAVPQDSRPPIPLAPRTKGQGATSPPTKSLGASQAITTVGGSLVVVLGLFLLFAWLLRKHLPASATALPKEVVELLGRAPLAGRQQLSLLRVGNKLVLLAVSPLGVETLTEITDPVEVDRLVGLCRSERPGSVAASFRQALTDVAGERASGFLGAEERPRRRATA